MSEIIIYKTMIDDEILCDLCAKLIKLVLTVLLYMVTVLKKRLFDNIGYALINCQEPGA